MDPRVLCVHCMEEKGNGDTCPHCGRRDMTRPESGLYLPPRTLLAGKYLIGRVLGHGGFGITYIGKHLDLDVKLAVKEFMPSDLATREPGSATVSVYSGEKSDIFRHGLERFIDEAKALAAFNEHPGIVSILDYFRENGTAYIVMPYMEGITLKEYLGRKGGKIPYDTALKIMMPVLDALREVHGAGMLHRDISPDNIYITEKGHVKLLDFGAARHAMGEQSKSLSVMLKPGYAPEEQYRSRGKQGPWTDVYAAAATIYHAITGEVPPQSLDRMDEDTLQAPSRKGIQIPDGSEAALLKALSVKAVDRFQTVKEFQEALTGAVEKNEKVYITANPTRKAIQRPDKHRMMLWGIGAAIAFGAVLGFVLLLAALENRAFEQAKKINSITALQTYLEKHPSGKNAGIAAFDVGMKYIRGDGVEKNGDTAKEWFTKAYPRLKKEAETGHKEAFWRLGYLFDWGYAVTKDYAQAKYWYEKSANQGNAEGQWRLAYCYYNGYGVTKDYTQAKYWVEKSANQGNDSGQFLLGTLYHTGEGVTKDYAQAKYWYEKSANQGNDSGQCNLGLLYYFGQGVTQDDTQAKYWFEKSAAQGNEIAKAALKALYKG